MIAYLTKVQIDFETAVKRGLKDSYAWHQKVWEAFPNRNKESRDFLTRLDDVNSGFRLLILSKSIPTRPEWCPTDSWKTSEMPDSFLDTPSFRFSVIVNATEKKVVRDEQGNRKKNGKRIPIVGEADLLQWFQRKATQHGFSFIPEQMEISPMPRQYFIKKGKSGLHAATHFQGVFQVTDKELFSQALTSGIGTAKAFGFGMLCLSPIQ